ncbi:hypothetical protein A4A49_18263 [Nicotiana attenuata]|uniref:Carboxypeptidase A inhibitor-like domain-containing protein n=1 Tax=Nicotiana attenuata TaxID=49451 RepID=A0A1J6IPK2_NICAT|nr:hypothetical protein A4A49_18263 [Nicotiana attenuata]
MARSYAFYFTIALMVMSVYLAQSPVLAVRDLPTNVPAELKSKLTGGKSLMSGCGGYCRSSSDCYDRYCKYCYYDVINHTYGCG